MRRYVDIKSVHSAGTVLSTDVCIVGGGPCGITLAEELSAGGRAVVVLEAGSSFPARGSQRLAKGEVDRHYYPLERTRIFALGGASNHWMESSGMRARPLEPLDFEARPDIGRPGWPYGIDTLMPYYDRAKVACRLAGTGWAIDSVRDGEGDAPLAADDFETVLFRIGPLDNWPERGRSLGNLPGVQVVTDAAVDQLLLDESGTRVGRVRVALEGGSRLFVEPRFTVLAAGGIENPWLLLASNQRRPQGVGNGHDQVGRWFAEHPHVFTGVLDPADAMALSKLQLYQRRDVRGQDHLGMLAPRPEVLKREGLLNCVWELQPAPATMMAPAGRALKEMKHILSYRKATVDTRQRLAAVAADLPGAAAAVRDWVGRRLGQPPSPQALGLHVMTEQAPNPESRITLSPDRDHLGRPRAKLRWRLTPLDYHTITRSQQLLAAALESSGMGSFRAPFQTSEVPEQVAGGFHHLGRTRMASDPAQGVVDADGKVNDVEDLFITGTSVMPAAGYANPTLTIVALAFKLADHLKPFIRTLMRAKLA